MAAIRVTLLVMLCSIIHDGNEVDGAVVYTRWGRQTCGSSERELVYTGYIGGGPSWEPDNQGSGSSYLCLPRTPKFGNYDATFYNRARIRGVEYGTGGSGGNFPFDVPEETPLQNQNMLCAVCLVQNASVALMIPAMTECYTGWTMEYTGYLVAQRDDLQSKTEYICLDKSPQGEPGGGEGEHAAFFHSVEGECGALPCPPYGDGWELACVVCTKEQ